MIEQQGGDQLAGAVPATAAAAEARLQARAMDLADIREKARLRPDERLFLWVSRIIIWAVMALIIIPILLVLIASLTAGNALFVNSIIPQHFSLEHYGNVFDPNKTSIFLWLRNSFIVCTSVGIVTALMVASTGYAFSRFRFYGRKYGLMGMLLIQMFPAQMSFVALYFFLLKIGLLNTLQGLIVVFIGGGIPFMAWLFKGYVDGLPRDLEESAYVDGATKWQAFWKVILPLTRPMLAVVFIFTFIGVYNDFILTNFLIQDPNNYTITVGLHGMISQQFGQNWNDFAAGALLAALPITVVFLTAQKWLVSGLAAGAVKG
ncbi:MAG TPA: sugar ABC transporter permease [Chloroflexota bacterium]|nr:sugar ABC transporter permease [Chloroflexota bacterium]